MATSVDLLCNYQPESFSPWDWELPLSRVCPAPLNGCVPSTAHGEPLGAPPRNSISAAYWPGTPGILVVTCDSVKREM